MTKHTIITTLGFLLFSSSGCYAQKVFAVQYTNQADIKLFVVDYPNQADLKVNKVKYQNQVGKNNGIWFFTNYANQADVKIYFVAYKNQAGWVNNAKKHYLY